MKTLLRPALVLFVLLTLISGLVYPLLVTGIAQTLMPKRAGGSLVLRQGQVLGSELIAQNFSDPGHFWGRPSAAAKAQNVLVSGGANLGPSNPALTQAVRERIAALSRADPGNKARLPIDLVTTSASGLDPHLSVAAARYQAPRIARVRGLAIKRVLLLIDQQTQRPWLGWFGQARVNVLQLNLALDAMGKKPAKMM